MRYMGDGPQGNFFQIRIVCAFVLWALAGILCGSFCFLSAAMEINAGRWLWVLWCSAALLGLVLWCRSHVWCGLKWEIARSMACEAALRFQKSENCDAEVKEKLQELLAYKCMEGAECLRLFGLEPVFLACFFAVSFLGLAVVTLKGALVFAGTMLLTKWYLAFAGRTYRKMKMAYADQYFEGAKPHQEAFSDVDALRARRGGSSAVREYIAFWRKMRKLEAKTFTRLCLLEGSCVLARLGALVLTVWAFGGFYQRVWAGDVGLLAVVLCAILTQALFLNGGNPWHKAWAKECYDEAAGFLREKEART